MDRQIAVLKQQYLQLVEPSCLSFPPVHLLQQSAFQAALCAGLFTPGGWDAATPPPPERYTARVLKRLISLLSEGGGQYLTMAETTVAENSLQEEEEGNVLVRSQPPHKKPKPDQHPASPKHQEIDERILSLYTRLLSNTPFSSTTPLPTTKENVTYTLPPSPFSGRPIGQPITLLESRAVISGSGTTGLRTWEAALALAEYLIVSHLGRFYRLPGAAVVAGERLVEEAGSVLELGAGTGLVGIVAARLGAGRVVVTDGDDGVCDALKAGLERNGVADVVSVRRLMWGEEVEEEEEGNDGERFDLVVGADVTYDSSAIPHLVAELVRQFHKNPSAKVVISATIRDEETFSSFRDSCAENSLLLLEKTWAPPTPPIFYYPTSTPIRIVHVTRESSE